MAIKKAETTRISLVLDNETLNKIKTIAKSNNTTVSTIIREAIWTTFLYNKNT